MHAYERHWPEDPSWTPPPIDDVCFLSAHDVARFAEIDPTLVAHTWPEVWHLDDHGAWQCGSSGSSLDSVRSFAADPARLLRVREVELGAPCPNRWVIVEPRHPWLGGRCRVEEDDARAFLILRQHLARHGITLLDVVVFAQELHWWSLHELTSGAAAWPDAAQPPEPGG